MARKLNYMTFGMMQEELVSFKQIKKGKGSMQLHFINTVFMIRKPSAC